MSGVVFLPNNPWKNLRRCKLWEQEAKIPGGVMKFTSKVNLCQLSRYSRKSLPFFRSSVTTRPNSIKIGTVVAPGEADSIAEFHLDAFLCYTT